MIVAGCGRVTQILTIGGLVSRDPRELYRSILWTTRVGERRPGRGGCYHLADGSSWRLCSDGCFPPRWYRYASQTGTFRFGTVVTTATGGGGGGQTPKPAPPVKTGITAIETLLLRLRGQSRAPSVGTGLRWYVSRVANQVMARPGVLY